MWPMVRQDEPADHIEPFEMPEPDGCSCEQALHETCERLSTEIRVLRDEITSLQQAEKEAWQLAQDVLQAETLYDAKVKASIYLGLTEPF